jgi:hypothetical protein
LDAIRYALLRELAPGLRHALMGELQAIQLLAELAARTLGAGADPVGARDSIDRIVDRCSDATKSGRALVEWMRPEPGTTISIQEGVAQCIKLASEGWFLYGIEVRTDLHDGDIQVQSAGLRELVVAALLILTDISGGPSDVHVSARSLEGHVQVVIRADRANRVASMPPSRPYRKLGWADLELLASARSVACARDGNAVSLRFPVMNSASAAAR